MSFFFSISEGLKNLRRVSGATILAVLILTLAIAMVGTSFVVGRNGQKFIKYLRSQFDLTAFVQMETADEIVIQLVKDIGAIEGVRDVTYISPAQAARKFEKEFGEDVLTVLGTNPFPASVIIRILPEFGTAVDASYIASRIANLDKIEEVRYRKSLLVIVDKYIKILIGIALVVGFVVLSAAVLISSYTIKLAIFAKRNLIWTMRLVGATDSFIRRPFVIEGMVEGLIAGILAAGVLKVTYIAAGLLLRGYLPIIRIEIGNEVYLGMLVFGLFLGWFSSNISVRKYLREKM